MTSGSSPDRRVWRCWVMGKPFLPRIYTDEHGSSKSMLRKRPLQGSLLYPCSSVQIRGKKKSRRQRLRGHGLARREAGDGFGDGADMVRRGAAAAADEVDQAGFGEDRKSTRLNSRP